MKAKFGRSQSRREMDFWHSWKRANLVCVCPALLVKSFPHLGFWPFVTRICQKRRPEVGVFAPHKVAEQSSLDKSEEMQIV